MAAIHRRALGSLLLVVVLLAACQPVTRPEPQASAALSAVTEADIPALIDQLDDPNWLAANQAAEALATLGRASAQPLLDRLFQIGNNEEGWRRRALILRALEPISGEGVTLLSDSLLAPGTTSIFRAFSALGLSRMGQPGYDALVTALENREIITIGAAPLLGEQALPALRSWVSDPLTDEDIQKELLAVLVGMGEATLPDQITLFDVAPELQSEFVGEVLHGAAANPLLRHIASSEAYSDDIRVSAVVALGETPVDAASTVPLLTGLLEDVQLSLELRRAALDSLGSYRTQATDAIPLLEGFFATPGDPLQAPAALALGRIAPGRSDIVAQLAAQLVQCDPVAAAAAQSLGNMGQLAWRATEALLDVFDTCTDPETPVAAAAALGQVAAATPAIVDALAIQLTGAVTNSAMVEASASALGHLGPPALPTLAAALVDLPAEAKGYITTTLAQMGPVAAPVLIDALLQPEADAATQQAAASALVGIGSPALPFMIEALSNDDNAERQRLVDALYAFGAQAMPALQLARADGLTVDPNRQDGIHRWCAEADNASGASGADAASSCLSAADVLPTLIAGIESTATQSTTLPDNHREVAIQMLGLLGPSAAAAAPLLGQVLMENDVKLQCAAAQTLQKMGGGAALAGPAAAQALTQVDAVAACGTVPLRQELIDALGSLGPNAEYAIPQLMTALEEPSLRRHAAEALGAIGGAAYAPLLALLRGAEMDDESVDQRRAAAYALHQDTMAWGPALTAQVAALAQNESESRYVRAMLAAGLAKQGYPLDGIWLQLDLPNPAAQACWNWPAIRDSGGVIVMGYDLYQDACLFASKPTAPTVDELINAFLGLFG